MPLEFRHGARCSQHQTQQCKAAFRTRLREIDRARFIIIFLLQSSDYHPYTIHIDGLWGRAMAGEIHRLRDKPSETEKITINVDSSTLAISICWCTRASTPIAPTSSGRRSATSSPLTRMPSSNRSCGTPSNSAYDTIAATDLEAVKDCWRQAAHPGRRTCDNRRRRYARTRACNNRVHHRAWCSSGQQSSQGGTL